MQVLENHFNGNTTFIVGEHIINGCQTFTKNRALVVFRKFKVPQEMIDETMEAYNRNIGVIEDYNEIKKIVLPKQLARINDVELLDSLLGDDDIEVVVEILKHKHPKHLKHYSKSKNLYIRSEVAKYNNKEILDVLVKDTFWTVRREVEIHGYKEHLDLLAIDERWEVRVGVAQHKHKDLLDILSDDKNWFVRKQAKQTLKEMGY